MFIKDIEHYSSSFFFPILEKEILKLLIFKFNKNYDLLWRKIKTRLLRILPMPFP